MEFDWDFSNEAHIARHKVEPEEAEEVATDPAALNVATYRGPRGEQRFGLLGATDSGRVLVVFYELRNGKTRVVTVRDATQTERVRYETED